MHLARRDLQWAEQAKLGELEVTLVVGWRHDALVTPKEMHVVERAWLRQFHHRFVKQPRDAAAGQRDGERSARVALGQALEPLHSGVPCQFVFVGKNRTAAHRLAGLGLCHVWLFGSSRSSAATGPHVPAT